MKSATWYLVLFSARCCYGDTTVCLSTERREGFLSKDGPLFGANVPGQY